MPGPAHTEFVQTSGWGTTERAKHGAILPSNGPDGFGPHVWGTAWLLPEECMAVILVRAEGCGQEDGCHNLVG